MKQRLVLSLLLACAALHGHPMGKAGVSHYARIRTAPDGVHIRHVLDLAEDPTREMLRQWKLAASSPRAELEARAAEQARLWAGNLAITVGGRSAAPRVAAVELAIGDGEDGMPAMRIASDLRLAVAPGKIVYEDRNYPESAGWKEIVVGDGPDLSRELTAYPPRASTSPPQDLRARIDWSPGAPPVLEAPAEPLPKAPAPDAALRADYLAQLLRRADLGPGVILAGLAVAFGLGAMHALSPGHGKTIVAAYLVGTRGTARHAAFLGGMVTFTHTISVFFLGFVTLFLSRYVLPEKLYPVLGAISGLSIVWIGGALLYHRWRKLAAHSHPHHHHHGAHAHDHDHAHGAAHDHGDGHGHSHVPEGDVTLGALVALGASGGLVPCPSALVLLLSSIALGRVALGMLLLVAFSAGLAAVLMGIGLVVVYAKHLLPDSGKTAQNGLFRLIPVLSAAVIVCVGLFLTAVSLGVIRPDRFLAGI